MTDTERRVEGALQKLQERYANPNYHWSLTQVHGIFTVTIRRLADGLEVKCRSTDLYSSVENTMADAERSFSTPPIKKGAD